MAETRLKKLIDTVITDRLPRAALSLVRERPFVLRLPREAQKPEAPRSDKKSVTVFRGDGS